MGEATFTFRVGDELKEAFSEAARAQDRTAAQLLCDYMREVVRRQRKDADYEAWLREKVESARASARARRGVPADEVEKEFAELRSRDQS